ncbi:MAG: hypothetical protein HOI33_00465 [Rhodospirillaceae bacterium]|jgi:peroxiredoxin family protein|nr:hypothetical protein [Rhodospirillaceae bacterium]MBT5659589.1 hypothetical protein [Rhodospirillaceae bacterium]MBT5751162.1 hypothetical protein [Rhodospirillaceae bacterium]
MNKAENKTAKKTGIALIVFSGDFERVHYALVTASAAAATNRPATLFFTHQATRALLEKDSNGTPGWHGLGGQDDRKAMEIDAEYIKRGIAGFEELLTASNDLGVTFMVCEMGLRAIDLEDAPRRADIAIKTGGMVSFLSETNENGRIIFI